MVSEWPRPSNSRKSVWDGQGLKIRSPRRVFTCRRQLDKRPWHDKREPLALAEVVERVWVVVPLRRMRPAVGRLAYGADGLHAECAPRCPATWRCETATSR